jgi:hypothetical protein
VTIMVLGQHVVPPPSPPEREKLGGNLWFLLKISGPGSIVGIVTGYGLDGLGIESQLGARFSIPSLEPTQLPVQWVLGLFLGKEQLGHGADPSPPSTAMFTKE